jgi:hypothetical protein
MFELPVYVAPDEHGSVTPWGPNKQNSRIIGCRKCGIDQGREHFFERVSWGLLLGGGKMKEALQTTVILVVWIVFWLGGTFGGAVLQARLVDIGVVSDIDPPWIITIGSSFIGFFAGAYAAVKLGDLKLRKK